MSRTFIMLVLAGISTSVCLAQSNTHNNSDATDPDTAAPASSTVPFNPGVLYYRDPETGELTVPPPEFTQALQADALNFSDEGLKIEVLPDGTKRIDLKGRYQMSTVIRGNAADGETVCTNHPHTEIAAAHHHGHDHADAAER